MTLLVSISNGNVIGNGWKNWLQITSAGQTLFSCGQGWVDTGYGYLNISASRKDNERDDTTYEKGRKGEKGGKEAPTWSYSEDPG